MPEDFEATVRASGGSLAVTIPRRVAEELGLGPGARVRVRLLRGADISGLFGAWKGHRLMDHRKLRDPKDYPPE